MGLNMGRVLCVVQCSVLVQFLTGGGRGARIWEAFYEWVFSFFLFFRFHIATILNKAFERTGPVSGFLYIRF